MYCRIDFFWLNKNSFGGNWFYCFRVGHGWQAFQVNIYLQLNYDKLQINHEFEPEACKLKETF